MEVLKSYLTFLSEISKWKEKVASGELSKKSIEKLKKSGVAKSPSEYYRGFQKGTKEILRKSGAQIRYKSKTGLPVSFVTSKGKPLLSIPPRKDIDLPTLKKEFGVRKGELPQFLRLAKRHEADELSNLRRIQKKFGPHGSILLSVKTKKGEIRGHTGPEVLEKERKYLNLLSRLYGDPSARKLLKFRTKPRGEYEALKDLTRKKVRELRKKLTQERLKRLALNKQKIISMWKEGKISTRAMKDMLNTLMLTSKEPVDVFVKVRS